MIKRQYTTFLEYILLKLFLKYATLESKVWRFKPHRLRTFYAARPRHSASASFNHCKGATILVL